MKPAGCYCNSLCEYEVAKVMRVVGTELDLAAAAAVTGGSRSRMLIRCLRLWEKVRGRRMLPPLASLAQEFGVCERTVMRDIAALHEAHLPVPPPFKARSYDCDLPAA